VSRPRARFELGFWSVAFAYLAVMAVGTVPSPLYGLYQARDGFSTFTITLIFAAYSAGSTASLFLAGHISDWHGRKRILLPGLLVSASGAAVFLLWRSLAGLIVARVLGGVAVGMVAATATAYLLELHGRSRPGTTMVRAQLANTVANVGGLGLGALISGLLAQYVSKPLTMPYVVFLAALGIAFVLVAVSPDTRERPVPRPKYRPQRVSVPQNARGQFFAAIGAAAVAFAGLGLFTGLAGVFLVGTLHRTALSLAGVAVFMVFAGGVAMQFITLAWSRRLVLIAGMVLLVLGLGLVVMAAWLSSPSLAAFLIGGAITGAGAGAMFKGSLVTVMMIADPEHRAESAAGVLLAGYVGLSVPAIGVGVALQEGASTKATLLAFALLVAAVIVASAPALLRGQTSAPERAGGVGGAPVHAHAALPAVVPAVDTPRLFTETVYQRANSIGGKQ
jgi:MFS family permease